MHRFAAVALAAAFAVVACTGAPRSPHATAGATTTGGGSGAGALPGVTSSDPAPVRPAVESSPPRFPLVTAVRGAVTVRAGEDWSMPSWVRPAANSGFFSEQTSPDDRVTVRSVDQSWRELAPRPGVLDTTADGAAQNMYFDSLRRQLAKPGPFWMRIFASGVDWAPEWVVTQCKLSTYGPDYDGQRHLPLWNECLWKHLLQTYRQLFVDEGLRADPRLQFVYVPGAFTWAEYDYEMMADAVKSGDLTFDAYKVWYDHAWKDLADIFGPYKDKLVFTGEDYPFGPFEPEQQDGLAAQAVAAGIGIRNGISEESNFHLSEAPAYGSHIQPDGHMVVDESLPVHDGHHVVATENECYNTCGFTTDNVPYAVEQSDLKALQLRMNWIYVVPDQSDMTAERPFWDWVRLSMGQGAASSPDAWAELRDAEDTYWNDATGPFTSRALWPTKPFVRNLERWLVQRDVPGGVAKRATVDVHTRVFVPENGVAYEGLSTDTARGQNGLYLDLDQRFLSGPASVLVKVTYWDAGRGTFVLRYPGGQSVPVSRGGGKAWKTATFRLDHASFDGTLPGGTDLGVVRTSGPDLVVKLVRLVRVEAP